MANATSYTIERNAVGQISLSAKTLGETTKSFSPFPSVMPATLRRATEVPYKIASKVKALRDSEGARFLAR